jgi:uncharacterized RDD family membrane protein YckC
MKEEIKNFKYAGFWIRTGATFIDAFLIIIITFPLLLLIYGSEYFGSEKLISGFWDFLISWLSPAVATILFWKYRCATPGKMVIKAKILDAKTGQTPSNTQLIGRYFAYLVSMLPLFFGFLWIAWDKKKQGWHDKLAGTVVVRSIEDESESIVFEK